MLEAFPKDTTPDELFSKGTAAGEAAVARFELVLTCATAINKLKGAYKLTRSQQPMSYAVFTTQKLLDEVTACKTFNGDVSTLAFVSSCSVGLKGTEQKVMDIPQASAVQVGEVKASSFAWIHFCRGEISLNLMPPQTEHVRTPHIPGC